MKRSLSVTLALLTSAATSSSPPISSTPHQPLAFTTTTHQSHTRSRHPNAPSTRIRKRALAQSLLRAAPTADNKHGSSSEFTRRNNIGGGGRGVYDVPSLSPSGIATHNHNNNLSPTSTLGMMVDSQREFEINLGRAIDTLTQDYPKILTRNPDFKIYSEDMEVIDPTGVSLHGLNNYKRAFSFIHGVVGLFYDEGKSGLTSIRVGYDWARKCIRVSWNVELVPRLLGTRNMLHVDGISEYYLDRETGLINEHRVSHLIINNEHVRPVNGIFHALAEISPIDPESIPVYSKGMEVSTDWTTLPFQTWNPFSNQSLFSSSSSKTSSLFADPSKQALSLDKASSSSSTEYSQVPYDRDALQRKNASRKKFGMPPLTPEEFIKIEEEVRAMDALNKKKAAYLAEQLAQQAQQRKEKDKNDFLSNIFGGVLKNGCESNFDCERPQVCCDVGFKKICCSNGLGIVDGVPVEKYQRGLLRMPIPNDNVDY